MTPENLYFLIFQKKAEELKPPPLFLLFCPYLYDRLLYVCPPPFETTSPEQLLPLPFPSHEFRTEPAAVIKRLTPSVICDSFRNE